MKLRLLAKQWRKTAPQAVPYELTFDVFVDRAYAIEGSCASADGPHPKAGIAVVSFLDEAGERIPGPYPGLGHSRTTGAYRYLAAAGPGAPVPFSIRLRPPAGARQAQVRLGPWRGRDLAFAAPPVWRELSALASASDAASPPSHAVSFEISPEQAYAVEGRCVSPDGFNAKAAVAVVTFLDETGVALPGPYRGLSHSKATGAYRYLAAGPPDAPAAFSLRLMPPPGARQGRVSIRRWAAPEIELPEPPVWRAAGLLPETEARALRAGWHELLAAARAAPERPLVVISTGTKPIGESHRANRSMHFALELAALGCPTLYVYYRHEPLEPLPPNDRPGLLQMPNDQFHACASEIAASASSGPRLFLCSIADFYAVHEQASFAEFGWSTVYEVRDDWEEFDLAGVGRWYHHLFERQLCHHAERVVTVSPALRDKMITFGAPPETTRVIPNGTTDAFIAAARTQRRRRREQGDPRGRPVVGYFGHLTAAWFDWTLLSTTAATRPDVDFEVIGFGAPDDLALPANVRLLGPRSHDEIIALAERWTLGLIPFQFGKLARAVDPIKIYEYLALGLRTVACPMGRLEDYPLTFLYRSAAEFAPSLDRALGYTPTETDWQRIEELLAGASWRERIQQLLAFALEERPVEAARLAVGAG